MPLPFTLRPLLRACALAFTVSALSTTAVAHQQTAEVQISRVWQYAHALGGVAGQKAEIVAYDDRTDTLWVAGVVGWCWPWWALAARRRWPAPTASR